MEMAFRSKAQAGALLIFFGLSASLPAAEPAAFQVRHRHLRHSAEGILRVSNEGISFEEAGKHKAHSSKWRFEDIEQLTLSPDVLRILTYENRRWPLRENRGFVFDNLPEDLATKLYPVFSGRLDQRFVAALADGEVKPLWEIPAKFLHRGAGSHGTLLVGTDRVVYRTEAPEQSRTWRIPDIDVVSSSGPFDLTVTTFERSGSSYAGHKDFQFELKRPLAEAEYDGLWRKVNQAKGLQILNSSTQIGEKQ
jgi:hypothetical protein